MSREAVIVSAVRTAVGKAGKGTLRTTRPDDMAAGDTTVAIAGGTESMSLIPMGGHKISPNPTLLERYPDSYLGMGVTAELVAKKYGVTREKADAFSLASHGKA